MSKVMIWNDTDIIKRIIFDENECKYNYDNICFNNNVTCKLGKKCHKCKHFIKEDMKKEPIV